MPFRQTSRHAAVVGSVLSLIVGCGGTQPPLAPHNDAPSSSAPSSAPAPPTSLASAAASAAPAPTRPCEALVLDAATLPPACDCAETMSIGLGSTVPWCPASSSDEAGLTLTATSPRTAHAGDDLAIEVSLENHGPRSITFRVESALGTPTPRDASGAEIGDLLVPPCTSRGFDAIGMSGTGEGYRRKKITLPPAGRVVWRVQIATVRNVFTAVPPTPSPPSAPKRRRKAGPSRPIPRSMFGESTGPVCTSATAPWPPGKYIIELSRMLRKDSPAELAGTARVEVELTP